MSTKVSKQIKQSGVLSKPTKPMSQPKDPIAEVFEALSAVTDDYFETTTVVNNAIVDSAYASFLRHKREEQDNAEYEPTVCPVCCMAYPEPHSRYCGAECRQIGHMFRRRMGETRKFLHTLGFESHYVNGVSLVTSIPSAIQFYYPTAIHKFAWPYTCWSIDSLNADDYWEEFTLHMGVLTSTYAQLLEKSEEFRGLDAADSFARMVRFIFQENSFTYVCMGCHQQYISSDWSNPQPHTRCIDCINADIPF